jgi:hypothetical protein
MAKQHSAVLSPRYLSPSFRRIRLQINDQATDTNSESSQRIFQRCNRSRREEA